MESLIETFCLENGELSNLQYHQERVNWSLGKALSIDQFVQTIRVEAKRVGASKGKWRATVTYSIKGIEGVKLTPYKMADIIGLALIPIPHNIYPKKWADRSLLDSYKKELPQGIEPLFVLNHFITDTSFTNVVLERDNQLYTPSTPLLHGTKRRQLLQEGLVAEAPITDHDLSSYTYVHLVNAMLNPGDLRLPISSFIEKRLPSLPTAYTPT